MEEVLHISATKLFKLRQLSTTGAILSGSVSNGAHIANGVTALFIATGQDVANVAESSAGYYFGEILPNGDYYYSITIPALIVASYGGGTGLPTQRECLEVIGLFWKRESQQTSGNRGGYGPLRGTIAWSSGGI